MEINYLNISYLQNGNSKQQHAYKILNRINIFSILSSYHPVLVGTIPIGIDVEKSDLDIVCKFDDVEEFSKVLSDNFKNCLHFNIRRKSDSILVANFFVEEFEIEIYASPIDPMHTNGYRHMIIESRILKLLGNDFKRKIIELKQQGIKTEPAFGCLLNLQNNPYEELLKMEDMSNEELQQLYWKEPQGL